MYIHLLFVNVWTLDNVGCSNQLECFCDYPPRPAQPHDPTGNTSTLFVEGCNRQPKAQTTCILRPRQNWWNRPCVLPIKNCPPRFARAGYFCLRNWSSSGLSVRTSEGPESRLFLLCSSKAILFWQPRASERTVTAGHCRPLQAFQDHWPWRAACFLQSRTFCTRWLPPTVVALEYCSLAQGKRQKGSHGGAQRTQRPKMRGPDVSRPVQKWDQELIKKKKRLVQEQPKLMHGHCTGGRKSNKIKRIPKDQTTLLKTPHWLNSVGGFKLLTNLEPTFFCHRKAFGCMFCLGARLRRNYGVLYKITTRLPQLLTITSQKFLFWPSHVSFRNLLLAFAWLFFFSCPWLGFLPASWILHLQLPVQELRLHLPLCASTAARNSATAAGGSSAAPRRSAARTAASSAARCCPPSPWRWALGRWRILLHTSASRTRPICGIKGTETWVGVTWLHPKRRANLQLGNSQSTWCTDEILKAWRLWQSGHPSSGRLDPDGMLAIVRMAPSMTARAWGAGMFFHNNRSLLTSWSSIASCTVWAKFESTQSTSSHLWRHVILHRCLTSCMAFCRLSVNFGHKDRKRPTFRIISNTPLLKLKTHTQKLVNVVDVMAKGTLNLIGAEMDPPSQAIQKPGNDRKKHIGIVTQRGSRVIAETPRSLFPSTTIAIDCDRANSVRPPLAHELHHAFTASGLPCAIYVATTNMITWAFAQARVQWLTCQANHCWQVSGNGLGEGCSCPTLEVFERQLPPPTCLLRVDRQPAPWLGSAPRYKPPHCKPTFFILRQLQLRMYGSTQFRASPAGRPSRPGSKAEPGPKLVWIRHDARDRLPLLTVALYGGFL